MTNVTLSIDEEDLRQARVLVLQQGSSLNAIIRQFVKNYIGDSKRYQHVTNRIIQQADDSQYFSEGKKWTRDELYER